MMYYRARYYMPEIGRFIQEDPHPGKSSYPLSFISKYIYTSNNPVKYVDPNGKFLITISFVLKAIVVTAGVVGAYINYKDAIDSDSGSENAIKSAILGGVLGALSVGLSIAFPPFAPLIAGGAALLNNIGNQYIHHPDDISLSRALLSGVVAGVSAWALGPILSEIGLNSQGEKVFGNAIGVGFGVCYDSGISTGEFSIFCGVNFDPDKTE